MNKNKFKLSMVFLFQVYSLSAFSKTFSCNGTYTDSIGSPYPSIHTEQDYTSTQANIEINGEDSKFLLKGYLKIKDSKEFLNIELISKENGFTIYNNNSQLGQPVTNGFNFVFLGMKNIGKVITSKGVLLDATEGSFQCQTY